MDKVYRAVKNDIGEVKYFEEIPNAIYSGEVEEGIWYIRKNEYGNFKTWICSKVDELQENITKIKLLPLKDKVFNEIEQNFENILEAFLLEDCSKKLLKERLFRIITKIVENS